MQPKPEVPLPLLPPPDLPDLPPPDLPLLPELPPPDFPLDVPDVLGSLGLLILPDSFV